MEQLRQLPDHCVDLCYIDPPFNSNRNYEVFWGETKEKRSFEDRHASTQAYIEYMRPRCVEIARVLKPSGSFYYHCDWHASHYVKVMLDAIFGENNFQNEIVWKRSTAHSDARQGSKHYGRLHDVLLFYTGGSEDYTWNQLYLPLSESYIESHYTSTEPDGRRFRWDNLTGPGGAAKGNAFFDVLGVKRYWRFSPENMRILIEQGRVAIPPKGKVPALKRYLSESKGTPLQSVWDDLAPVNSQAKEALGYPTQKPLALLERLIKASSNDNDIVLDALLWVRNSVGSGAELESSVDRCRRVPDRLSGYGEALARRMRIHEDERLRHLGRGFVVRDLPQSEAALRKMPPFEFENWAVIALGGSPNKAQVGDMGLDGRIYPTSAMPQAKANELDFMNQWYPIHVKQKDKAGRPDIDSFEAAMIRAERQKGFFVSFDYTGDALTEIQRFFRQTGKVIVPLTVKDILEDQIAHKLA